MKITILLLLFGVFSIINNLQAQIQPSKRIIKTNKTKLITNKTNTVSNSNKIQTTDFDYYENGLLKKDLTKGILQINYVVVFPPRNHPINPMFESSSENRASEIILTNNRKITYEYLADGTKLGKKLYVNNQVVKEYAYEEDETYEILPNGEEKLVEIRMDEGRLVPHPTKPNEMIYEYDIKDHLNNTRITFTENPTNPNLPPVIVQAKNYDPFGLELKGISTYDSTVVGYPNLYRFNGKQFENDFDIGLYDYGSRLYDPRLGRWQSPDPLAPMFPNWSPFAFSFDNPVNNFDPDGRAAGPCCGTPSMHPMLAGVAMANYFRRNNAQASNMVSRYERISGQSMSFLDKTTFYASTYLNSGAGNMSDVNDAAVLTRGRNVDGTKASSTDKILAGFGLIVPFASGGALKEGIQGVGGSALQAISKKVENISSHLSDLDVSGAILDLKGTPVTINGRTYDHLDEVTNALKGLGNQIQKLNTGISNGTFTGGVLSEAERVRSGLQTEKDRIQNVLNKYKDGN